KLKKLLILREKGFLVLKNNIFMDLKNKDMNFYYIYFKIEEKIHILEVKSTEKKEEYINFLLGEGYIQLKE
ncbi:MAG: hypothetical protein Q4B23_06725, partial [Helcococcus sp.]|nr:hypothetical protein [Helcococcus sp.]